MWTGPGLCLPSTPRKIARLVSETLTRPRLSASCRFSFAEECKSPQSGIRPTVDPDSFDLFIELKLDTTTVDPRVGLRSNTPGEVHFNPSVRIYHIDSGMGQVVLDPVPTPEPGTLARYRRGTGSMGTDEDCAALAPKERQCRLRKA